MKIRINEDGKQFESEVLFTIEKHNKLYGVGFAGNITSCRAIHAGLYRHRVEIEHDDGRMQYMEPTARYKRAETIEGKVNHTICLPKSTAKQEYNDQMNELMKADSEYLPERVLISTDGDIKSVVGNFIAETYGIPKTWKDQYLDIFKKEGKIEDLIVQTTSLARHWQGLQAVEIARMKEKDVLDIVERYIKQNTLNVQNVKILGEGTFKEGMTTEEYLRQNATLLTKKIDAYMKPIYDGAHLSPYFAETNRISLPAQAKGSMAILEVIKRKKGGFIVGDMGTGKTQMSLSAIYVKHKQRLESGAKTPTRVLIVAPSNVVPKWIESEVPKILGKTNVKMTNLTSTNDAIQYVQNARKNKNSKYANCIEFVLVSTDRMKLTAQGFVLGAKWNPHQHVWISPNTGKPLVSPKIKKEEKEEDCIAGWSDVVQKPAKPPTKAQVQEARKKGELLPNGIPKGYIQKWRSEVRAFQDNYRDEKQDLSLARPARKEWGETTGKSRWMIAQILQRKLNNHFHFGILDEVHQMKASDSGRGLALAKIVKSCRKVIMLTGTLTNGSASSIQSLLWRVFPSELIEDGFSHQTSKEQWASRYGVLERVVSKPDDSMTVGATTNRKKENVIVRERPGIAPGLISRYLLDKSVFAELPDLNIPLVKLKEMPIAVDLDQDHYDEYKKFHNKLESECQNLQREIGSAAWSQFQPSTINYADQPQYGPSVEFKKNTDTGIVSLGKVSAPDFPNNYVNAKERKLLEVVQQNLREKRRCIIFTHFTGEYGTNARLKKVLEMNGIHSEIMDNKVSTAKRFSWLEQQAQKGTEVLIMNQRLVEVGLDLLEFPSLLFWQMNDDISVVRQASRRSWRISQHRECRVYFFVAKQTKQMAQFQRLMSRRVSAMIVEGRIERSDDLAKYADDGNNLTRKLADSIAAWEKAAAKDVSDDIVMVEEDEFQEAIEKAFERLTRQTIKLCGYDPDNMPNFHNEGEWELIDLDGIDEAFEEFEKTLQNVDLDALLEEVDQCNTSYKNNSNVHSFEDKQCEGKLVDDKDEDEEITSAEQLDLFELA